MWHLPCRLGRLKIKKHRFGSKLCLFLHRSFCVIRVFDYILRLLPQISLGSLLRDGYSLLFNLPFMLVLLTNGLINGFSNDAAALLTNNLGNLDNNSQSVAGWVGAIGNGMGLIVGVS